MYHRNAPGTPLPDSLPTDGGGDVRRVRPALCSSSDLTQLLETSLACFAVLASLSPGLACRRHLGTSVGRWGFCGVAGVTQVSSVSLGEKCWSSVMPAPPCGGGHLVPDRTLAPRSVCAQGHQSQRSGGRGPQDALVLPLQGGHPGERRAQVSQGPGLRGQGTGTSLLRPWLCPLEVSWVALCCPSRRLRPGDRTGHVFL